MRSSKIRAFFIFSFLTSVSHATVVQYFYGNTYVNPSTINKINDFELVLGATSSLNINAHYTGEVFGTNGSASSNTHAFLPNMLIAKRVNPNLTIGVNVSQPVFGDLEFPANSVVAPFTTKTLINAVDINPMVSYKINEKLSIGGGFIAEKYYNAEVDYVSNPLGTVTNKYNSWAYGWDVGLHYVLNNKTFLGLAYFSQLVPRLHGKSVAGGKSQRSNVTGFQIPPTIKMDITRIFTDAWLGGLSIYYSKWNSVSTI